MRENRRFQRPAAKTIGMQAESPDKSFFAIVPLESLE